nr:MAG TPA: hypothetical protein [Caudoviricetes sp.]
MRLICHDMNAHGVGLEGGVSDHPPPGKEEYN